MEVKRWRKHIPKVMIARMIVSWYRRLKKPSRLMSGMIRPRLIFKLLSRRMGYSMACSLERCRHSAMSWPWNSSSSWTSS